MRNLAEDIMLAAGDELIEAIVLGSDAWSDEVEIPDAFEKTLKPEHFYRLLAWDDARPLLDCEYDDGFGGAGVPPLYAWTENKVIVVHEYDGSTTVGSIPRHPADGLRPTFA